MISGASQWIKVVALTAGKVRLYALFPLKGVMRKDAKNQYSLCPFERWAVWGIPDHLRKIISRAVVFLILMALSLVLPAWGSDGTPTEKEAGGLADLEKQIAGQPTLSDLVAYAYLASPMIKAARAEWRAAVEKYRIDTAFDDPELMLEGMYVPEMYSDPFNPDDWEVTLTQPLPLPGRLAKAGVVASVEAGIARLRLDSTVRDATLRLRESYHELLYLREAKRLAVANRDLLDQLRKVGETAVSNRATLVDIMKAQAQSGQLQYDALLLQESGLTEQTRINSILDRAPDAPIGNLADDPVRPVVYSLQEIYSLAELNLEEIRMARASVSKAEGMVDLTRYENLPQFKLGVAFGEVNQTQQVKVQAGFSLPLWFDKRAGRLGTAQAEVEKMRALRSVQINETRAAIRDTYFRLQNSDRLITLYRDDLIPQANRAMQTAETWFKTGQGSFSDSVETASAWYNFYLALARAKADYGKFLARLESLAGRSLTERDPGFKAVEPEGALHE